MAAYRSLAFRYYAPGDVRREELRIACGPREMIVKVLACARCGTDRNIFRKGHPKVRPPTVLGHEIAAEVAEVGCEVRTLTDGIGYRRDRPLSAAELDYRVGERITCQSRIARYRGGVLLQSDPIQILSFQIDAGYSRYMKVTEEMIRSGSALRVPEGVSDEEAALVEPAACALETIFQTPHAMGVDEDGRHRFRAGIRPGGRALVIGSGTVSMIYALLCRIEGAAEVHVLVRSQAKADLVRRVLGEGFRVTIAEPLDGLGIEERLEREAALVERLRAGTGGVLFDDVISACADPDAQRLMLKCYNVEADAVGATFGGTRELVDRVDLDVHHYRQAKTIGSSGCSTRCMETVLRWLAEGKLSLRGFTSPRRFTLADDPAEFFETDAGGLKPVLYPWE
jgi:L-iditol 2-dehydrogenase